MCVRAPCNSSELNLLVSLWTISCAASTMAWRAERNIDLLDMSIPFQRTCHLARQWLPLWECSPTNFELPSFLPWHKFQLMLSTALRTPGPEKKWTWSAKMALPLIAKQQVIDLFAKIGVHSALPLLFKKKKKRSALRHPLRIPKWSAACTQLHFYLNKCLIVEDKLLLVYFLSLMFMMHHRNLETIFSTQQDSTFKKSADFSQNSWL